MYANGHTHGPDWAGSWAAAWGRFCLACFVLVAGLSPGRGTAQVLGDFGYAATGTGSSRPMLVVLAYFDTGPAFPYSKNYYDDQIFNPNRQPGVSGYFKEVSNNRFTWVRAGAVGPVLYPASQLGANFTPASMNIDLRRQLYHSNMVHQILMSGMFDFRPYDLNRDGVITRNELVLVVISNDGWENTSNRQTGFVRPPGSPIAFNDFIVRLDLRNDFASICHEICHSLGAIDLYGNNCAGQNLTLMSCTIGTPEAPDIYHPDPWHKMRMAWSEPRIRSMSSPGSVDIPPAQVGDPTAPVILYDPSRGASEYFMVEYRTGNVAGGGRYDAYVAGTGMVLWRVNAWPTSLGAPSLEVGGNVPWAVGQATPILTWANGASTNVRLRSEALPDGKIRVTWLTRQEMWVDFKVPFFIPQFGTFDFPFNSLAVGQQNVGDFGTIWMKQGTSAERPTVSKPMTLRAYDGPVTIGR